MPIYFYIAQRYSSGTLFLFTGASPLGGSEENQWTFWHLNSQQCITFFCGYRSCAFPNCQFQQLVVTCLNWNFVHDNTGNTPLILTVPNLRPNYVIFTPKFQAWTFSFFNLTHLFGILNFRVYSFVYMITNWTLKYCIPCSQRWASLSRRAKENTKYTDFQKEEKRRKE